MVVLVTGANGQLGCEMRLRSVGSSDSYIFSDIAEISEDSRSMLAALSTSMVDTSTLHLDITDINQVREMVRSHAVDVIVNCAAYTNVEAAEDNEALASKLNSTAPSILAKVMQEVDGNLIHISTDYVFGGHALSAPCKEDTEVAPLGVYGRTKLEGEREIARSGCPSIIIRTAWLYSEFGKNFCLTIRRLSFEKESLNVVCDQRGTPTYAADLATAIGSIISERALDRTGIYHFSNEGECTWYDFAKKIAQLSGNLSCKIMPCKSSEYPSKVQRPSYSVLDKTKYKTTFHKDISQWEDSLEKCIKNINAKQ
ncbi:MAG: dTDP-4-dehydrorhamnose reductase [Alistipes sp.]|nr:dTDP-4-dehydrorhamnose reductase [Candidatus Alistipes equi]